MRIELATPLHGESVWDLDGYVLNLRGADLKEAATALGIQFTSRTKVAEIRDAIREHYLNAPKASTESAVVTADDLVAQELALGDSEPITNSCGRCFRSLVWIHGMWIGVNGEEMCPNGTDRHAPHRDPAQAYDDARDAELTTVTIAPYDGPSLITVTPVPTADEVSRTADPVQWAEDVLELKNLRLPLNFIPATERRALTSMLLEAPRGTSVMEDEEIHEALAPTRSRHGDHVRDYAIGYVPRYRGHWNGVAWVSHHGYGVQVHRTLSDARNWVTGRVRIFGANDLVVAPVPPMVLTRHKPSIGRNRKGR